jgi:hypothetical protein
VTGHNSLLSFLRDTSTIRLAPGICVNNDNLTRNYIIDVTPTANGYRENCRRRTAMSCLKLANIV